GIVSSSFISVSPRQTQSSTDCPLDRVAHGCVQDLPRAVAAAAGQDGGADKTGGSAASGTAAAAGVKPKGSCVCLLVLARSAYLPCSCLLTGSGSCFALQERPQQPVSPARKVTRVNSLLDPTNWFCHVS